MDIGNFVKQRLQEKLPNEIKLKILHDIWVPPRNYKFPFSEHSKKGKLEKRYLSHNHLQISPCFAFSEIDKGVYCRICFLFAESLLATNRSQQPLGTLVTKPLTNFSKLTGKEGALTHHIEKGFHKTAQEKANSFLQFMANPMNRDIRNKLDEERQRQAAENRKRLKPIIETILFHGRQNIPLRGHRDDGQLVESESHVNEGNFRATLRLRIQAGDKELEAHLQNTSSRATYISKVTQNELITAIGNIYMREIISRVNNAGYFSVISDGTTDISKKEQLSVIVRYIDSDMKTREDFLCFSDLLEDVYGNETSNLEPRCTGSAYAFAIQKVFEENHCTSKMVGIGLDGASVNTSERVGVASILQKNHPVAVSIHCASHCLNLCLMSLSSISAIRNTYGVIKEVNNFFTASAKRTFTFSKIIKEGSTTCEKRRLSGLCETRWVERHDAVDVYIALLDSIIETLSHMKEWQDRTTSTKASCLLSANYDSEFIVALHVLVQVLSLTKPLSKVLQSVDVDLCKCLRDIEVTVMTLKQWRQNCDDEFKKLYSDIENVAERLNFTLAVPRLTGRQKNRSNHPFENPEEYYRRSIYIPFLDNLIGELEERFSPHKKKIFVIEKLVPSRCADISSEEFVETIKFYSHILQDVCGSYCSVERDFHSEIAQWKLFWKHQKSDNLPTSAISVLHEINKKTSFSNFPIITTLLRILATMPATVASAERSFSKLRLLKTYLRNTMNEERLSALANIYIHRDIKIDSEDIINEFAGNKSRRLDFIL